jgi:serine/threonine protein kinase
MYFQEKDGYTESWKLIDFSAARFVGSNYSYNAKIIMNYSAPEIIMAYEREIRVKADFAMDMFSFGLILYFLETGNFLKLFFFVCSYYYAKFILRYLIRSSLLGWRK